MINQQNDVRSSPNGNFKAIRLSDLREDVWQQVLPEGTCDCDPRGWSSTVCRMDSSSVNSIHHLIYSLLLRIPVVFVVHTARDRLSAGRTMKPMNEFTRYANRSSDQRCLTCLCSNSSFQTARFSSQGERPFACISCPLRFYNKSKLTCHFLDHHAVRIGTLLFHSLS